MSETTPAKDLLNRFEAAWRTGSPPRLEDFLPSPATVQPSARRLLLQDLIKLDLEYRWRRVGARQGPRADCPRLEDYVRRYPELGGLQGLDQELIAEEYWVRQRWGDRPPHAEYAGRFQGHEARLQAALREIDAELAAEFAGPRNSSAALPTALVPAVAQPPVAQAPAGSVAVLLTTVRQCQLLAPSQLEGLSRGQWANPRDFARDLLQRGWLTPYQANQLLKGEGTGLLLGSYVLLQRLGEGGAGRVFLARHLLLNRDVALKVIRADRRTDPEVVRRFIREIGVLGQLQHANVVHAHDAGTIGTVHYLAMEFVAGVDLGKLVKQAGPLPVALACDYIRQAALGLQYIHEHGLIHRDIKPSNLLVSGGVVSGELSSGATHPPKTHHSPHTAHQVVKILDLGLAGFQQPTDADGATNVTETGTLIMGTLDFMAPEQALDFHRADIRADIYSLGCTFYYLLTGQPPFDGGTLTQKLLRHQQSEPPSLEQFRRDLPAGVPAVLRRMMAKRPEDRYQRPGEVAEALAALSPPTAIALGTLLPDRAVPAPTSGHGRLAATVRELKQVLTLIGASGRAAKRSPGWFRKVLAVTLAAVVLFALFTLLHEPAPVYLTDLEEKTDAKRGEYFEKGGKLGRNYGLVEFNLKHSPRALSMAPYYGPVKVSYQLGKKYRTFKADVAIPDRWLKDQLTEPIVFSVLGDHNLLWTSVPPIGKAGHKLECLVNVSGIEQLDLLVTGRTITKIGGNLVYGVWLEPHVK